jgi:hypothetical protein
MAYCEWTTVDINNVCYVDSTGCIKDAPTTATKCYEYLAARGFLLHRMKKEYMITNFRGGRCFKGSLVELKQHLKDTYYGEPKA